MMDDDDDDDHNKMTIRRHKDMRGMLERDRRWRGREKWHAEFSSWLSECPVRSSRQRWM